MTAEELAEHCARKPLGEYSSGKQVIALVVVLLASTVAVYFPVLCKNVQNTIVRNAIFVTRHFGTGVIISTALVHLFQPAVSLFSDECLGKLATESVPSAFTLVGIVLIFAVEFWFTRFLEAKYGNRAGNSTEAAASCCTPSSPQVSDTRAKNPEAQMSEAADIVTARRKLLTCTTFEAGIIFHSVIVGVTLGTASTDKAWMGLFIALIFHQVFEGISLGHAIAQVPFKRGSLRPYFLAGLFAVTTPLGIGIGIGVHSTFNASDAKTLWAMGALACLSAGILLWSGFICLLSSEWVNGPMKQASNIRALVGMLSVIAGAVLMTLIGHWI